ncbi:uncharacterized protein LOC141846467 [Curcuma longa]|uniref:uncharacterized protein LOC141846467 n=1 Tax=Curcuma longa TaxID=136217 RepID=UPI003D9F425A
MSKEEEGWLWHRRLGHINMKTIAKVANKELVKGLPKLKYIKDKMCDACQEGYSIFRSPLHHYTNLPFSRRQRDHTFSDFYVASGGPPPTKKRRIKPDGPVWDAGADCNPVFSSCWSLIQSPRREEENSRRRALSDAQPHERREPVRSEAEDAPLVTRREIEMCSPSRKDGIDCLLETQLRYSYCSYLQHLGLRLDLPQTTIGAAMVLCHRFFFRRSYACNDRFVSIPHPMLVPKIWWSL